MGKKVADMLKLAILTENDYEKYFSHISKQIISAKSSICKDVISHIKKVIKSKSFPPQQKLRALNILNACMESSNTSFITCTQDKILTRLSILASYKKEVPVPVRAEGIFGPTYSNNPVFKEASIEFINSLLLYLKSWASNFGKCSDKSDSLFYTTFRKLKESGVAFPVSEKVEEKVKAKKKLDVVVEVENILELLQNCKDENLAQDYKEMIKSHVNRLKSTLKQVISEGKDEDADEILMLLDRIAAIDIMADMPLDSPIRRSSLRKIPENDFEPLRSTSDFSHSQVSGAFSVPGNWSQRTSSNFEHDKMTTYSDISSMRESVMTAPIRMDSFKKASINEPDQQSLERLKRENIELLQTVELNTLQLSEKNSQIRILEQKVADLIKENQRLNKEIEELKNNKKHQPGYRDDYSLKSKTNIDSVSETKGKDEDLFEFDSRYKKKSEIPEPKAGNRDFVNETKGKDEDLLEFDSRYKKRSEIPEPKAGNRDFVNETKGKDEDLFEMDSRYKKKSEIPEPKTGSKDSAFNFTFSEKSEKQEKIKEDFSILEITKKEEVKVPPLHINPEKTPKSPPIPDTFSTSLPKQNSDTTKIPNSPEKSQTHSLPLIQDPKKNKEKKTPNDFSPDSSSDEDLNPQIQIPFPDLPSVFRKSNCCDSGLLFENDSIQIGFQLKLSIPDIFCILLIGNKSSTPITEVTTELLNLSMDSFPIIMQPIKTTDVLNKQSHTSRMLKGQFINPTSCIPSIKITLKSDSVYALTIKLPITIVRFCIGVRENPGNVWNEWKKMAFEEKSFGTQLGMFSDLSEICRFMGFGTAFAVYSKSEIQELGVCEFLAAGRIQEVLALFAVNVNQNAKEARVRVRCRNERITDALIPVITCQISNNI